MTTISITIDDSNNITIILLFILKDAIFNLNLKAKDL